MRCRIIAAAIALGLGVHSVSGAAALARDDAQTDTRTHTVAPVSAEEVRQLRAELAALRARVALLEGRADASANIPGSTIPASTGDGSIGDASTAYGSTRQGVPAAQKPHPIPAQTVAGPGQPFGNTALSGKMFFDFTHLAVRDSDRGKTDQSGIGLDVKRFYLGVNHTFDARWSANLTTDFSYASAIDQASVYVKKAYVQGKFADAAVLRVGSSDLPWVPLVENAYGFRYVENTLIDRLKFGGSTDWGVHLGGVVGTGDALNYAVSMVNGGGYKRPGRSKSVDFEGRIGYAPFPHVIVAAGGYSGKLGKEVESTVDSRTAQRGDLLVAYSDDTYRFGAEYFSARNWNNVLSPLSDRANGYSLWGSVALSDAISVFARYDQANLSRKLDRQAKNTYYNLGVQYQVTGGFKLAGVWKHEEGDRSAAAPAPTHVQTVKSNEIGVWGEVAF